MILDLLQTAALVLLAAAALLFLARLVRGPGAGDRILALDALALTVVGYLLYQGDRSGGHDYLDAALTLALLSFVATIALARVAGRSDDDR